MKTALVLFCFCFALVSARVRAQEPSKIWGQIANERHRGEKPISALFFAGPPSSTSLYTRHPLSGNKLDWHPDSDIDFALEQMTSVGLNTIKLSYWGHEGETDKWSPSLMFSQRRWPNHRGTGNYTETEQVELARHFFKKAAAHGLMIAPMIEVSPAYRFSSTFPDMQPLLDRATWLLKNLGDEPN